MYPLANHSKLIFTKCTSIFLILVLLVPYQTRWFSIALPSIFLIGAFLGFLASNLSNLIFWRSSKLPFDYWIGFLFLTLLLLSSLIINDSQMLYLRPYLLVPVIYITVRQYSPILNLHKFFNFVSIYLIISGCLAMTQLFGGEVFFVAAYLSNGGIEDMRSPLGIQNIPTIAGLYAAICSVLIIGRFCFSKDTLRPLDIAAIFFGTITICLCSSRASFAALFFGVVYVLIRVLRAHTSRMIPFIFVMMTILAGSFFGYTTLKASKNIYALEIFEAKVIESSQKLYRNAVNKFTLLIDSLKQEKSEKVFHADSEKKDQLDGSIQQRILMYKMASGILMSPSKEGKLSPLWFGIGIGNTESAYKQFRDNYALPGWANDVGNNTISMHNSFIEFLLEAGLIPFLVFLVLTFSIVIRAWRDPRWEIAAILGMFFALCTWMILHDYLRNRPYWILLALLAGLIAKKYTKKDLVNSSFDSSLFDRSLRS